MIIGYARVSKIDQNLDRQIDALEKFGVERIITEKYTGTKKDREGIQKLLDITREGDTVVVESVSRLGRKTIDVLGLIEDFEKRGVKFVSIKENFDTSTAIGRAMLQMMVVCAEMERNQIAERIAEGIEASKKRGKKVGRPRLNPKQVERALRMYDTGEFSIKEILETTGISQGSFYRALHKRELDRSK